MREEGVVIHKWGEMTSIMILKSWIWERNGKRQTINSESSIEMIHEQTGRKRTRGRKEMIKVGHERRKIEFLD